MLFEAYGQFSVFLAFIWFGFIATVVYKLLAQKKIQIKTIFDFAFFSLCGMFFIYFLHKYNMGQVRLFLFIGIAIGILLEKILLSKTLESFKKMLYNYLRKFLTKAKFKYLNNLKKYCLDKKPHTKSKHHLPKHKKVAKTTKQTTKTQPTK